MKPASPFMAVVATIALHAVLIGVAMTELSPPKRQDTALSPLAIQIVPERLPAQAEAPMAAPSPTPPVAQEKSRPEPRRRAAPPKPAPAPKPRPDTAAVTPPDSSLDTKPAPATIVTAPSAPEATAPALAAPAPITPPPARTRASDANYAASNRLPPYPRLSQSNNEEGTVLLRVLVKADGTAGAIEIKKSSGYPLLDKSASTTVQTWRFTPATVNGKPVDEWYEVPIPFKLQNN